MKIVDEMPKSGVFIIVWEDPNKIASIDVEWVNGELWYFMGPRCHFNTEDLPAGVNIKYIVKD